jgi:glycosyltransferase involved in cell wall biosynthesis
VLDNKITEQKVDTTLKTALEKQFDLGEDDFVLLFIGTYKHTSGVDSLIQVFEQLCATHAHLKLILVGDGPMKDRCDSLIAASRWKERIYTVNRIAYTDVFTYQSLAQVIVCPDEQNGFSEMIVHVKYFDALLSGKVVVNGSFSSVQEINPDDMLSVSFTPSSQASLFEKLKTIVENYSFYREKYAGARAYTITHLTYEQFIAPLITAQRKNP